MDPNTENADTTNEQAAEQAAVAEQAQPEVAAEPAQAAEADPFTAGVEEARAQESADAAPPADPDKPAETPEGDPPADEPKPQDPPSGEPAKEDPKPDPAPKSVDEEIKDLGITNERTQKRFRELSDRAAEADQLRERATRAEEWERTVTSTGANPQQFGNALNYLAAINSGSPDAMAQAYEAMQKELQWLGQKIGREAPGFDPVSAHADLAEKVASGDLTRETAAELAQLRQRGVLQQEQQAAQHQTYQAQQAEQQGLAQVQELGNHLRNTDPGFGQKMQYLIPTVELIQQQLPPAQWAQAIHTAYQKLPAASAPAPAAPVRASNTPTRASTGAALAAKPNAANAFDFGVAEARARGM